MNDDLLDVRRLVKEFAVRGDRHATVRALDDVSFSVRPGETFGIVGESGSGKSTLARCIARVIDATSGTVSLAGEDLLTLGPRELRRVRRTLGFVFQNPVAALDPRMVVEDLVAEPLRTHERLRGPALAARVLALLDAVGLSRQQLRRYPHQLSGGQCQRIGIARALATRPALVLLDEPTSALDLSVQAQILNLLAELRAEFTLTYLLISHDLDVVRHMSDRVGVLYLGRLVETGPALSTLSTPAHPYTAALLAASPGSGRAAVDGATLLGEIPSATDVPPGCRFHPRCPRRVALGLPAECAVDDPVARETSPAQTAACHFPLTVTVASRGVSEGDAR